MAFVTEERSVFPKLTTRQNLAVGRADIAKATALFPELEPLMSRRGGLLSGGEQQMLTLARALARPTDLLLADELSLGLAPQIVGRLLRAVRAAADSGVGALLVEQHVHRVLEIADRVYLLHQGQIQFNGTAAEARGSIDEIQATYLTGGVAVRTIANRGWRTGGPSRLADMDAGGIDMQVLSMPAWSVHDMEDAEEALRLAKKTNDTGRGSGPGSP